MALLKCKMCGGSLSIDNDTGIATCEYCGTRQTVSKTTDDVISNLYNRANNLRLKNEFDKAQAIYEKIIEHDDSDAEAHWGILLCKYGIEYVDDPKTGKKIPTCHRTSFDSIKSDIDYQAAIDYSNPMQQVLYEEEAREIEKLQRDILSIAKNEKPFDVFICYKETDEDGKRTVDSTIANDIYYQLTQEGFKVFYAAITLEDKLGQEYEPYIFSALNTAKVMLVIGTKPQYFDSVWVKNEWSRYLSLIKEDRTKVLIPCYRDMDAYELPDAFAHLQAQDMSKIGFMNDVIRGIKKIIIKEDAVQHRTESFINGITQTAISNDSLLKRAKMFLEDKDYNSANDYYDRVLDNDPENGEAYLGKFLISNDSCNIRELQEKINKIFNQEYNNGLRDYNLSIFNNKVKLNNSEIYTITDIDSNYVNNKLNNYVDKEFNTDNNYEEKYNYETLVKTNIPLIESIIDKIDKEIFDDNLYIRALQFSDNNTKKEIEGLTQDIEDKLHKEKDNFIEDLQNEIIPKYKKFVEEVDKQLDQEYVEFMSNKEKRYESCITDLANKKSTLNDLLITEEKLRQLGEYKDAQRYLEQCRQYIEKKRKRKSLITGIITTIILMLIFLNIVGYTSFRDSYMIQIAKIQYSLGDYNSALASLEGVKDNNLLSKIYYQLGNQSLNKNDYWSAGSYYNRMIINSLDIKDNDRYLKCAYDFVNKRIEDGDIAVSEYYNLNEIMTKLAEYQFEESTEKLKQLEEYYENNLSVVVPNLLNTDFRDATEAIRKLELKYEIIYGTNYGSKVNDVYYMIPSPNEAIQKGSTVYLYVHSDEVKAGSNAIFTITVTADTNVRKSCSLSAEVVDVSKADTRHNVYNVVELEGYTWYRIGTDRWIVSTWTKKN